MEGIILAKTLDMDHSAWLEWRRKGIGGSDAAAILGLNPYASAFAVYLDKLGLAPEQEENEAMWLGTKLEPIIADRFTEETGLKVQRRNAIYQHPEHPWMLANIDRWIVGRNAGLEIKTTNMLNRTRFDDGEIPPSYYAQCVHYMAVTGADEWHLAVAVLNKGFHVFKVDRNESEIEALIAAERDFWEEHVAKHVPPAPDGSARAGELVKSRFPVGRGDASLTPLYGLEDRIALYVGLQDEIEELERRADAIKQELQLQVGEADGGQANGWKVWWKTQSSTTLDSTRLKKERPDIYEQYARTSAQRRFSIKKEE